MQSLNQFEQALLSNFVDLASLKKADPIKTTEERRAEWLLQRRGKFTASEFHRLMAFPNLGELPAGAKTYAKEKAVEMIANMDESDKYISVDMQWGIDHEVEAIQRFAEITGKSAEKTGDFQDVMSLGNDISCTPDGLILGEKCGIEVKCPKSKTHFEYCLIKSAQDLKAIAPEYYWQVMGSMHISGYDSWYFISYDPRYKKPEHQLHYLRVDRNEKDIEFLGIRLLMAIVYRNMLLREFSSH